MSARMCLLRCGRLLSNAALIALAALALAGLAHPAAAQNREEDAPARVGRVSTYQGELYLAPQDRATEWAGIGLNYPVATGDNLWMSGEGHAEVDYGGGRLRLGGDTNVHVSRLDDRQLALFIAQGRLILRVRTLEAGESVVVDTPNAQIELPRPGLYRIDVSPEPQQTWLIVREGEANVVLPGGAQQVLPGQTATVAGIDSATAEVHNGVTVDGLDTWSAARDRVYERGRGATAYVSREMVGYADLDAYGQWQTYTEYGPVWFPTTVVSDWAPYRYGRWVWLSAYGWTWVDDAPWGYAPFHYGRWAFVGGRWGWCPGAFVDRPVWAPALVAWYGGSGWSYSASFGAPVFGWVPLGWRDPLMPWWGRCSARCYDRYNRPYAVSVAERANRPPTWYANSAVPGAVTAVPGAAFRAAKPVQVNRVPLPAQALAAAPLLTRAPQVKPLAVATNVVQAGRGAPLTAGQIAARIKPMAVAPLNPPASAAAFARGGAMPVPSIPAVGPAQRPALSAPGAAYGARRGGAAEALPRANASPGAAPASKPVPLPAPRLAPAPVQPRGPQPVYAPPAPMHAPPPPAPVQPRGAQPVYRPPMQVHVPSPAPAQSRGPAPVYVPPAPRIAPSAPVQPRGPAPVQQERPAAKPAAANGPRVPSQN